MKSIIETLFLMMFFSFFAFGQQDQTNTGGGLGSGSGTTSKPTENAAKTTLPNVKKPATSPLRILSKPKPVYTEEAKKNNIEGKITLRIVFKKDGTIGKVQPVSGLAAGLTESAIEAAKKIRFEPQRKDGKPVSVTKVIEYNFTLY